MIVQVPGGNDAAQKIGQRGVSAGDAAAQAAEAGSPDKTSVSGLIAGCCHHRTFARHHRISRAERERSHGQGTAGCADKIEPESPREAGASGAMHQIAGIEWRLAELTATWQLAVGFVALGAAFFADGWVGVGHGDPSGEGMAVLCCALVWFSRNFDESNQGFGTTAGAPLS